MFLQCSAISSLFIAGQDSMDEVVKEVSAMEEKDEDEKKNEWPVTDFIQLERACYSIPTFQNIETIVQLKIPKSYLNINWKCFLKRTDFILIINGIRW